MMKRLVVLILLVGLGSVTLVSAADSTPARQEWSGPVPDDTYSAGGDDDEPIKATAERPGEQTRTSVPVELRQVDRIIDHQVTWFKRILRSLSQTARSIRVKP